jgi:hypothetical protein
VHYVFNSAKTPEVVSPIYCGFCMCKIGILGWFDAGSSRLTRKVCHEILLGLLRTSVHCDDSRIICIGCSLNCLLS